MVDCREGEVTPMALVSDLKEKRCQHVLLLARKWVAWLACRASHAKQVAGLEIKLFMYKTQSEELKKCPQLIIYSLANLLNVGYVCSHLRARAKAKEMMRD
jgi:hypothetical protein